MERNGRTTFSKSFLYNERSRKVQKKHFKPTDALIFARRRTYINNSLCESSEIVIARQHFECFLMFFFGILSETHQIHREENELQTSRAAPCVLCSTFGHIFVSPYPLV